MVTVVGVRFRRAGKIYFFNPGNLELAAGEGCIVETSRGVEFGEIVVPPKEVPTNEVVQPLKQVLRVAAEDDYRRLEKNRIKAQEAFEIAVSKIKQHELPMNLLAAEYTLDESKLIFSFAAEGRVDFRELVKDLASIFRTRIELRQVGVRDEAKLIGGLGSCGRSLCCATFLGDFEPVSIRMAKDQNLSLNPSKISGVCGRLMCCLKFEYQVYEDNKKVFGNGAPAGGPGTMDEFYHEVEDEPDYYRDLLEEDSIQKVDYEMMVETAEVEKSTERAQPKRSRAKKRKTPAKAGESQKTERARAKKSPSQKKRRSRRKRTKTEPPKKG